MVSVCGMYAGCRKDELDESKGMERWWVVLWVFVCTYKDLSFGV